MGGELQGQARNVPHTRKRGFDVDAARHHIERSAAGAVIDYLQLVDRETLQPVPKVTKPAILAAAVFYGEVRLIDNIEIG